MASFVDVASGALAKASDAQQILDALKGTIGKGIPLSPTAVNDAIAYAFSAKNLDATNSRSGIFYKADGSVLLQIDKNGVQASPDGVSAAASVLTTSATQTLTNKTLDGNSNTIQVPRGTLASRPAAGTAGRLFLATDQTPNQLFLDTGTAWITAGAAATASAIPGANTTLTANTQIDLCLINLSAGTWWIYGQLNASSATAGTAVVASLRDNTAGTLLKSAEAYAPAVSYRFTLGVNFIYSPASAVTIALRGYSGGNASTAFVNDSQLAQGSTFVQAVRIG